MLLKGRHLPRRTCALRMTSQSRQSWWCYDVPNLRIGEVVLRPDTDAKSLLRGAGAGESPRTLSLALAQRWSSTDGPASCLRRTTLSYS